MAAAPGAVLNWGLPLVRAAKTTAKGSERGNRDGRGIGWVRGEKKGGD